MLKQAIQDVGFQNVVHIGQNAQFIYFEGLDEGVQCEIKVEKEDHYAYYKATGDGDWTDIGYLTK